MEIFINHKAKELGYEAIVITGNPEYYKKYGFENCSKYNIYYEGMSKTDEVPFFMIKILKDGKINELKGVYSDPECYTKIDNQELEEFEKLFPKKVKEKREEKRKLNMKIVEIKNRTSEIINQLLEVWENSVKATHLFLTEKEIENIKEYVPQAISEIAHLIVAENESHIPIAFMGIADTELEMLFIKNSERGKGLGKKLLNYGIENYNVNSLAVNEQNPAAKGFYEHMGFKTYKRTELDEQGNPYPILYMRLER